MPISPRVAVAVTIFAGLLLAGCAPHRATRAPAPATTAPTSAAASAPSTPATRTHASRTTKPSSDNNATIDTGLPERTGIAACDDYLSSYLACHRAAHIFAPDQLQSRYEAMRTSLLRDSKNPDIRPQLSERCNSLARSLRQALHGKPCATSPAPAASSP